jgi:hypothetical protein
LGTAGPIERGRQHLGDLGCLGHTPLKPGITPPPQLPKHGVLQEVFNLDEGQVTLSVPATLSPESYQDMADRIEIFLRGLKRRADAEAARRRADREDVPD